MPRFHPAILGGLCLIAAVNAPAAHAMGSNHRYPPKAVSPGKPAPATIVLFTCEESGRGANEAYARQSALEKIQPRVAAYLSESQPGLNWTPDAAYLWKHGVARLVGEAEDEALQEPVGAVDKVKKVTVRATLTSTNLGEMEEAARTDRVHCRQGQALRGLVGVVALLLATLGCLRLEEATRGYFSRVFRGVAVVVVLAVAAGLLVAR